MGFFDFLKKKEFNEIQSLKDKLKELSPITDINLELETKKKELENFCNSKISQLNQDIEYKTQEINKLEVSINELNSKYKSSLETYLKLIKDLSLFEDKGNQIEYGLYQPVYNFDYSIEYLTNKNLVIASQLQLAISEKAETISRTTSALEMSLQKTIYYADIELAKSRILSLMHLAFNNGASNIISRAKWNNVNQLSKQIKKLYKQINDLGQGNSFSVTFNSEYEILKQKELSLEHEYQLKKQKEKEEERANKELLREEEKARREYEKAQKEAEIEEINYQKSIDKIKQRIDNTEGDEHKKLVAQIEELEIKLLEAIQKKERAISMAQQTKRGHVYIISNLGAFGENVYKIGMTRRLEPLERVYELGNASVPFHFDIHAMIYSEDAPNLENELHKAFSTKKINMLNHRKEFFKIHIDEIESKIKELGIEVKLNKNTDAIQYRETLALIDTIISKETSKSIEEIINENYPENLLD
ncbi:DUF4041 domain-containing protein [Flavobacterium sp.]|jgi:hypothetical protein|uniref:DUF4041 domain-containing protein n=1 Tax=Flavobacterium sp. TaxID=239 RepID=UPI0037C0BFC7